jgi:acyl-coenzyme A synthetase/AMP-(fatty) acid ligase
VKLNEGCDDVGVEELIKFCRDHLPHYMASWTDIFKDLPKTSMGKTQKLILREQRL